MVWLEVIGRTNMLGGFVVYGDEVVELDGSWVYGRGGAATSKRSGMMFSSKSAFLTAARNCVLLGLLLTAFVLGGCSSCKEYQEQIMQLDSQIADLQRQVADKESSIAECNEIADDLRANLKSANAENEVLIEKMEEVVFINIPEELLFVSSGEIVREEMVPTLEAVAATVRQHPDWDVFVEGHTDDKKILEDYHFKWPTNWELGAARSCSVVRYLTNQLDLPAERFAAVTYGPYRPVAGNDDTEGRSQNRRVRIVLHKPPE
jgi:chemotaxis protein MotB